VTLLGHQKSRTKKLERATENPSGKILARTEKAEADLAGGLALSRKDEATGAGRGTDGKQPTGRRNRAGNEFTTAGKPNENRYASAARHQEPATRSAVSEKEKSWDLTDAGRANRERS
jgi:hypothetical protein